MPPSLQVPVYLTPRVQRQGGQGGRGSRIQLPCTQAHAAGPRCVSAPDRPGLPDGWSLVTNRILASQPSRAGLLFCRYIVQQADSPPGAGDLSRFSPAAGHHIFSFSSILCLGFITQTVPGRLVLTAKTFSPVKICSIARHDLTKPSFLLIPHLPSWLLSRERVHV